MADYYLRVALWQLPTMVSDAPDGTPNTVAGLSHDERCRRLEERLAAAASIFDGFPAPAGAKTFDVFAAPEYLFAQSATLHFVDVATKDRILEKLKQMTRRYPEILLFPGTIAWKKPMKVAGLFGKDRSKAAYRRLAFMRQKHSTGYQSYDQHKERLDQADKNTTFFAQNTAYVFRNGNVVLKYHKSADGGEVFREDRQNEMVIWVPGERKGSFRLDNLDIGLEICAERGAEILQKWDVANLDIQVLISASHKATSKPACTREGGYLLHADASIPPGAYRKAGGSLQPVQARHSFPALGGTVSYYGMNLSK